MVTCFSFLEPVCELPLSENVACWCSISFLIYIYNLSLSNNCTVETEFGHMFNFWRLERVIASPGLGQLSLRKCTLGHIDIAVGIIRNIGIWHRRWYLEMARNTGIVFPVFRVVRKLFHILAWQMPGSLLQTENPGQSFDRYLNYVFVIWSKGPLYILCIAGSGTRFKEFGERIVEEWPPDNARPQRRWSSQALAHQIVKWGFFTLHSGRFRLH